MKKEFKTELSNLVTINYTNEPPLYQVNVHNDDFTPKEFVVGALEKFFHMERSKAASVTFQAQASGKAICGIFAKDFAETIVNKVIEYAQLHKHPLICSMEAV